MRILATLLLALFVSPAYAALYKWTDENGKVHYSDKVPTEQAGRARSELNKRAIETKRTDRTLTAEERQARAAEAEKKHQDDLAIKEQQRRDKALLQTYTTEKEIDLARDRNLQAADLQLNSVEGRLKSAREKQAALQKEAASYQQAGKPLPTRVSGDLQQTTKEIDSLSRERDKRKADIDAIKTRFEADKKRFLELKQVRPK